MDSPFRYDIIRLNNPADADHDKICVRSSSLDGKAIYLYGPFWTIWGARRWAKKDALERLNLFCKDTIIESTIF